MVTMTAQESLQSSAHHSSTFTHRRLQKSGKIDELRQHFTAQLIESGWRDNMKEVARDVIHQHGGLERLALDQLIEELVPRGRSAVPPALKEEMMEQLRKVVREQKRR